MKKILRILIVLIIFALIGCDKKIENEGKGSKIESEGEVSKIECELNVNSFDKIKSELLLIPREYSSDSAVSDGCFVSVHGNMKSSANTIEDFILDSSKGKPTTITIFEYTIEGDPIITKTIYDGSKYYGIVDNTRDAFGIKEYHEFEFKYFREFKYDNSKNYYLLNDNEITYNEFNKSMISSNSNDNIEHKYLFSVDNSIKDNINKDISVK